MKFIIILLLSLWLSISSYAGQGFSTFTTTLAVANVRQTVSAAPIEVSDIIIQNPSGNVVSIFVGGSDVTVSGAAAGIELTPGASLALESHVRRGTNENISSSKVFIISVGTAIPVTIGITTDRKP